MKCITCKGRGLCGRPVCPILRRLEEVAALPRIGRSLEGMSPPEVFVGRAGYPLLRAGPMLPASQGCGQALPHLHLGMDGFLPPKVCGISSCLARRFVKPFPISALLHNQRGLARFGADGSLLCRHTGNRRNPDCRCMVPHPVWRQLIRVDGRSPGCPVI